MRFPITVIPRLWLAALPLLCLSARAQTASGWTRTFADEFTGPSLDLAKWNTTYMWSGAGARTLSSNNELQVYLDDQFELANGIVRIRAEPKTTVWYGTTYNYASGVITTYQKFGQQHGYFEMRARLPQGKGLWPAFWMVDNRTIWPPEIDIVEVIGDRPERVNMTVHSRTSPSNNTPIVPYSAALGSFDTSAGFHVYGVEWDATTITWYLDGRRVFSGANQWDMNEPMQLIANLAVGGNWPGAPDATTVFPAYLEIDYIRAWRRDSSTAALPHYAGYTVGTVGLTGTNLIPASGSATISGAGTGFTVGGSSDNFHFVARPLDGDGEIVLQVSGMSSGTDAQTGVMIRESTAPNARYSAVYLANGACHFQSRATAGAVATRDYRTPSVAAPRWLLLRRRGNTLTAFHSSDGRAWTLAGGRELTLPSSVLIGIAVSGGAAATLNSSIIANLDQPAEVILDNSATGSGVTLTPTTGGWASSSYTFGYTGSDYLHDNNAGKGSRTIRYAPTLSTAGTYALLLDWTSEPNRATNVPVTVTSAAGTTPFTVNQRINGDGALVGYFRFNSGSSGEILVGNTGTNGYVIADSIRLVATAPLTQVRDNSDSSGVATTGTWTASSSVAGFNGVNYLHDGNAGKGAKSVTFTPALAHAGRYTIALNWTPGADRAASVPVQITHADGVTNLTIDQRSGGAWSALSGTYRFDPAQPFRVAISNTGTTGYVIVDGVRFEAAAVAVPQASL